MCRNIHTLYNFDPPASETEIQQASLQYVRKVSGFRRPSRVNEAAFNAAVDQIARATGQLLAALQSGAPPRSREALAARAHERAARRFGQGEPPHEDYPTIDQGRKR